MVCKHRGDGYVVQILGPDIDELYQILDLIEPTANAGRLSGYTFSAALPDTITELAPPFEQGPRAGSYPNLAVARTDGTDHHQRPPRLLLDQPGNGSMHIAVQLDDRSTLNVTAHSLTLVEFIHAISSITFVDEATWTARYQPRPAVVPAFTNAANEAAGDTVAVLDDTTPTDSPADSPPAGTEPPRVVGGTIATSADTTISIDNP